MLRVERKRAAVQYMTLYDIRGEYRTGRALLDLRYVEHKGFSLTILSSVKLVL